MTDVIDPSVFTAPDRDPATFSYIERLAADEPDVLEALLASTPADEKVIDMPYQWHLWARPSQLLPVGDDWDLWMIRAGRGAGKTRSGAEGVRRLVGRMGYRSGTVIGRNPAEARDVMVEGPSGIIAVHPPKFAPVYESSKRLITWPNGAVAHVRSAEDPDSLRGLNSDWVWADEPASFRHGSDAWDQAMFGNRIGKHPVGILTGTPRPLPWLRELEAKPTTRLATGATYENLTNLAASFVKLIIERYAGTRLGRQEIDAEYLEDVEGALWTMGVIEAARFSRFDRDDPWRSLAVELARVGVDGASVSHRFGRGLEMFAAERRPWVTVVAVDPPGETAECGIAVGTAPRNGRGGADHCVILDDMSTAGAPEVWGAQVVDAYRKWGADYVLVEKNQGGDMVRSTIHAVDSSVNVEKISAEGSKVDRAEPVSVLYARGWVHHLGNLPQLESQQSTWVPAEGKSPDRVDALVHLVTRLLKPSSLGTASLPDQRSLASQRL